MSNKFSKVAALCVILQTHPKNKIRFLILHLCCQTPSEIGFLNFSILSTGFTP